MAVAVAIEVKDKNAAKRHSFGHKMHCASCAPRSLYVCSVIFSSIP